MFKSTFLGHQGWLLQASDTSVLIDPLLEESISSGGAATIDVYPPREVDHSGFPPISAVVITHEHDDHFSIESLYRLDRRVPIYLSARSSAAARRALSAMGFLTTDFRPGVRHRIGGLELVGLSPDHIRYHTVDEWDVLMPYVRDTSGHGSFFSSVDVECPDIRPWLRQQGLPLPLIGTYTINFTSSHAANNWSPVPPGAGPVVLDFLSSSQKRSAQYGSQLTLLCGGGWSFGEGLASLNRSFFPADPRQLEQALAMLGCAPETPVRAVMPGDTFTCVDGALTSNRPETSTYLRPVDERLWPARSFDHQCPRLTDLPAVFDTASLTGDELSLLESHLDRFAKFLVGSPLFLALNSLNSPQLSAFRAPYGIALRLDGEGRTVVMEYQPTQAVFAASDLLTTEVAAGAMFWARDLLKLFQLDGCGPSLLMGRCLEWVNVQCDFRDALSLRRLLWQYMHPLRNIQAYEALYLQRIFRLTPHCSELGG